MAIGIGHVGMQGLNTGRAIESMLPQIKSAHISIVPVHSNSDSRLWECRHRATENSRSVWSFQQSKYLLHQGRQILDIDPLSSLRRILLERYSEYAYFVKGLLLLTELECV